MTSFFMFFFHVFYRSSSALHGWSSTLGPGGLPLLFNIADQWWDSNPQFPDHQAGFTNVFQTYLEGEGEGAQN